MKLLLTISILFCVGYWIPAQDKTLFSDIKVNGLFSGSYNYNFNNPPDYKNKFRVFDFDNNSFKIDVFELSLKKDAVNLGEAGFRFDLTTGSSIPVITRSLGLASGDIDVHQLIVSYIAPIGSGIYLDIGKFVTPFGFEVIEGYDGYNDNYSRSFNFGYAVPFTHTGIKASYSFSDAAKLGLYLVNGWDNSIDNNKSKSVGAQFILSPITGLNILPGFMYGPEKANNNHDNRTLFDLVTTYSLSEAITLGINFDYGNETHSTVNNASAVWAGLALYFKYQINDNYSFALRGEQFNDQDGIRTGVVQKLYSITLTPSVNLNENLMLRGDIRYDKSDVQLFADDNNGTRGSQFTIGLNLIYVF
jgi:hypothetical protein